MNATARIASVFLISSISVSHAASISWGSVGTGIQVGDLITDGSPVFAVNGGSDADAGTLTIGDNAFVTAPLSGAVSGMVSNTGNGGFYSLSSGNPDLDTILDSHSYISQGNPTGRGQMDLPGLIVGNRYNVQILSVGDDRGCCAGRSQFIDDGNGNISGAMVRGTGDWVVGSFVAGATTESLFVTGETDPGVSGLILRDLGAVPEPSNAALVLLGSAILGLRRRR